jgi:hypothetical protein
MPLPVPMSSMSSLSGLVGVKNKTVPKYSIENVIYYITTVLPYNVAGEAVLSY